MSADERRYNEEEFAEILRRATEMQARPAEPDAEPAGTAVTRGQGISLEEIAVIAREVGIDPALIRRAAARVGTEDPVFEGTMPARFLLKRSEPGALERDDLARIVGAVRDAAGMHGETASTVSGVEWKTGEIVLTVVTADSIDDQTELRVSVDANSAKVLSHVFPGIAGLAAGAITGAALEPGFAAGVALMTGTIGAGLGVGNLIWRRALSRARESALRLFRAGVEALPSRDPTE